MGTTNVSNIGLQMLLTGNLQTQQSNLGTLTQELSTGMLHDNLTDYAPTDALSLVNYQNAIIHRQSYLSSMQTVQTRLSVYDSTMGDMESVATQAQNLASQNENYNASTVDQIYAQIKNYLLQVSSDLNQKVGDRYIYAGGRYTTQPVTIDPTVLNGAPQSIITNNSTLPDYDNSSVSLTVNNTANTITVGGTINSAGTASQSVTITINGTAHTYTIPTTDTTQAQAATYIAGQLATDTGLAITASGSTITVPTGQTINSASTTSTNASAYSSDTVLISDGFSVPYGVSSDDPSFQKLINGMRYIQAGITAGKGGDTATYQADMKQATTMLGDALSGIQALHTNVASNQNTLTQETDTQNAAITTLKDQISSIQQVDLTEVGTKINVLQAQLQASYSATAGLEQLSLLKYL